jgi:putative NADH-flavin reductase
VKLLVFGASGGTGRQLVQQALAQGHRVGAFVRDPARLPLCHPDLEFLQGDVLDAGTVSRAVPGRDAVLVALGAPSPVRRYPALTEGLRHIVAAMERARVSRLVYLSFIGVHDSRRQGGFVITHIASRLLRQSIADHEENEALIRRSRLEWTIVHPPRLTNGRRTGAYRHGEAISARSPFPALSRADVAEFMLGALADPTCLRKTVAVLP